MELEGAHIPMNEERLAALPGPASSSSGTCLCCMDMLKTPNRTTAMPLAVSVEM